MKLSTTLAIFLILLVSLSPVLATTYVIEHDDEVDQIKEMQEQGADRTGYDTELTRLQQHIEELRSQYAQQESERTVQDYYDRFDQYGRHCDRNDRDDLNDLRDEDENDLNTDDRRELRRLLRRCGSDRYDDGQDSFYDDYLDPYSYDRHCRLLPRDYADNFAYDDYLDDTYRAGRCARARQHLRRSVFDDYFGDFEQRYDDHNTSYDPYTDVLHELDDKDFFKYGPGAYRSWGQWCDRNRYRDGSLPNWCHERRQFIENVDWD